MKTDIEPEIAELRVLRVENGWVVMGWSSAYGRKDGYCPSGTFVATSPMMLADLLRQWAVDQTTRGFFSRSASDAAKFVEQGGMG